MKSRRHFAIIDIITNNRITTQEELCDSLKDAGYDITQATVSRDIKELHLVKIPDNEGYYYALPDSTGNIKSSYERMKRIFKDCVIHLDYSENIIVIRTLPGTANSVAAQIDSSENRSILGTVAGDDTICVIVKPKEVVHQVVEEFVNLIKM
ncbi:MAG: arginine repressor [Syntrophomonadaceae bacterium]|nr:arginine repressor [Syntrophomonadaceae bacterium]MDD3888497.1 arginine repressor [Syntrophomonadaceae bacterium]MDD4548737.1 arginine repressor [Syntrophomonadaceae bacterium]